MGYQGRIARWNQQRGFGFIKPELAGADIFVHISALQSDSRTPEVGERVSYQLGTGKDGKPCAQQVFFPDRPLSLAGGVSPVVTRPSPTHNESTRSPPVVPRPRISPSYRRKGNWRGKLIPLLVLAGLFSLYSRFSAESFSPLPASSFSQDKVRASNSMPQTATFLRQCDGRQHCSQMSSCEEATWFLQNCPNMKMDGEGDGIPCEDQWCGH